MEGLEEGFFSSDLEAKVEGIIVSTRSGDTASPRRFIFLLSHSVLSQHVSQGKHFSVMVPWTLFLFVSALK